jgi:hypothetical protein
MTMTVYADKIELSMEKSIDIILADRNITSAYACPSYGNLFSVDPNSPLLDQQKAKEFHTFVARILYVTRKVRMDLSAIVSFLSSRVQHPTEEDDAKLTKLLHYLFGTKHFSYCIDGILYDRYGCINVRAYIDSSHGVHSVDRRGQVGIVITIGHTTVFARSAKLKCNTKSSAETELIGVSNEISQALWTKYWLEELCFSVNAVSLYNDNQSAIYMLLTGRAVNKVSRHIHIREFFLLDFIKKNLIHQKTVVFFVNIFIFMCFITETFLVYWYKHFISFRNKF